jgi:hypothetical protein
VGRNIVLTSTVTANEAVGAAARLALAGETCGIAPPITSTISGMARIVSVFLQHVLNVGFLKCIAWRVQMNWALVFALALTLCATGVCADEKDDCNQLADADRQGRGKPEQGRWDA